MSMKLTDGFFLASGRTCLLCLTLESTTIIIIETERRLTTVERIPTEIRTTSATATGIINPTTAILTTGDKNIWNQNLSQLFHPTTNTKNFLSKSSDESLNNNLPSRSYNRYDDRYYGREDAAAAYAPDNRYNSNYNSYRGNGKRSYEYLTNRHSSLLVDPLNSLFFLDMAEQATIILIQLITKQCENDSNVVNV